jgi:hypothetical protein
VWFYSVLVGDIYAAVVRLTHHEQLITPLILLALLLVGSLSKGKPNVIPVLPNGRRNPDLSQSPLLSRERIKVGGFYVSF